MFLGAAVGAVVHALFPGLWAFLYQAPIGFGVAYVVAQQQARDPLDSKTAGAFAAICGGGGAFWFLIMGVMPSLLTLLLALAGMWIGISIALDRYLDIDWESSQRVTSLICGPVWLSWAVIGVAIYLFRGVL